MILFYLSSPILWYCFGFIWIFSNFPLSYLYFNNFSGGAVGSVDCWIDEIVLGEVEIELCDEISVDNADRISGGAIGFLSDNIVFGEVKIELFDEITDNIVDWISGGAVGCRIKVVILGEEKIVLDDEISENIVDKFCFPFIETVYWDVISIIN